MATFELERDRFGNRNDNDNNREAAEALAAAEQQDRRRIKQECIIALKVYDHCRHPYCIIQ